MVTEGTKQPERQTKSSGPALLRNVILLLLFAALLAALYFASGIISSYTQSVIQTGFKVIIQWLSTNNSTAIAHYVQAWGAKGPFVSALIMIFQSFMLPFPTFSVISANGMVFGAFWGTLLSLSSAMVGATLCFIIARGIGRPLAQRFLNNKTMNSMDSFSQRYGVNSVLIARLVPVVPFNTIVSYVVGFTSISFRNFLIATAVGQLPVVIVYSWVGNKINGAEQIGLYAFLLVAELVMLGFTLKQVKKKRIGQPQNKITH